MTTQTRALKKFQQQFPVCIQQPVQWGDMDALRHVNNTVYFRYFENARIALMERTGINRLFLSDNIGPVLGHTQCKYLRPLTWPDQITVGTAVSAIHEKRFSMVYAVFSHQQQTVAAEGTSEAVYLDMASGATCAIPDSIRQALTQLRLDIE